MAVTIINGKEVAGLIQDELAVKVTELREKGVKPCLATLLVGEDPASQVYIGQKQKACERLGILPKHQTLSATTTEAELLSIIEGLNNNPKINGILVQLPLPEHINSVKVLDAISPQKDVDGFHPFNVGKFFTEKSFSDMVDKGLFLPCTPYGIMELLKRYDVPVRGADVVVVGRSNIVGKPIALLLLAADATVTVCHSRTKNLKEVCQRADIIIAAIGKPKFVTADMVKEGVVVIDVGVNRLPEGLVGDVDFVNVSQKASAITPVPGGVGPMTITMLMANTIMAARNQAGI
ncbi:bifunctional 5,10-methylene-tetrahydrofolate dehydrogenase/5,10-methylene-tetrahydrofolate cyclohydrolase [Candidatus Desantisbacteria bacterium CG2_30_40_21]|uniref:Bifunctional protein FolD n=4 Tax=unclassified Candidatus Desantisiibacteriota TaxID=3106372 RepID=A0A2M7P2M1_9BACT|nr:MAG: bifunctional 5,10-methylene-tetrahydrofolate dehydrogenase/5,10-methylene-tetrahydrofolate cyclohydrolase [Candidatus Desantisbacteria bacterium CG2_30_40_21]PIP40860.1 MAG: bifunctional methylenetetrahydrofolate dehydrogenase/methenyltetrahydrofolate cyclohydrolase FolD [Candidatus Desantisbacteria bacterium CG23_combo_of_CG06-09_8_20_14_all_40_23]PIY19891.1 MAG: bifunctional methylenetetrahydrofolate dehydrogenase/methenyltetrahydrofolate cyclohydrolase FolD [Candidatus Desantisbacteria